MGEQKKNDRLDNTIKVIYDVLEKNKEKQDIQEVYNNIKKLKDRRNIE